MTDVLYSYEVKFYDEIDDKTKTARGILFANGFSDAVEKLEDYYGSRQIEEIIHLCALCETEVLELSKDTIDYICDDIQGGNY